MTSRRQYLSGLIGTGSIVLAGCLDDESEPDVEDTGSSLVGSDSPTTSSGSSEPTTEQEDDENCRELEESHRETVVDTTEYVDGGFEWTHGYRTEANDEVQFSVSASDGQDVRVEVDSPTGQTVYTESGVSVSTIERFTSGGSGEVRIANLGDRTETEREELWSDRDTYSAGSGLAPWVELREGDTVAYFIRKIDGARPKLEIESRDGETLREHAVAEVIDDSFEAPADGRYYFNVLNTATLTSGTWDYEFERVEEVPISTRVQLSIDREYTETVEICD